MIDGLKKIFISMGEPKQLYSDEVSSTRSAKMNIIFNEDKIKSVQTTTRAYTVGWFIRAFKMNLYRGLGALDEDSTKWVTHVYNIVEKYVN